MKWQINSTDQGLVLQITKRAMELFPKKFSGLNIEMALVCCHLNGCPLALKLLLEASESDFMHDIAGIFNNLDRGTGKLADFFSPRFALSNHCGA